MKPNVTLTVKTGPHVEEEEEEERTCPSCGGGRGGREDLPFMWRRKRRSCLHAGGHEQDAPETHLRPGPVWTDPDLSMRRNHHVNQRRADERSLSTH